MPQYLYTRERLSGRENHPVYTTVHCSDTTHYTSPVRNDNTGTLCADTVAQLATH